MDRLTLDLRVLVQEFSGLTVEDILARIAEPHPKREFQRRAMGWIRYSINHGRPHPNNFVKIHSTLRTTPAQAAGVTHRLWEIEDLVALLEA